jgi:hypothetical protein
MPSTPRSNRAATASRSRSGCPSVSAMSTNCPPVRPSSRTPVSRPLAKRVVVTRSEISPMAPLRAVRSALAVMFGRYPSSTAMRPIFSRISGEIRAPGVALSACDTAALETPARSAISASVGRRADEGGTGSSVTLAFCRRRRLSAASDRQLTARCAGADHRSSGRSRRPAPPMRQGGLRSSPCFRLPQGALDRTRRRVPVPSGSPLHRPRE